MHYEQGRPVKQLDPLPREFVRTIERMRFDDLGTPDRELPNCPKCEEGELYGQALGCLNAVYCRRCMLRVIVKQQAT